MIFRKQKGTAPKFAKTPTDATFPEKMDVLLESSVEGSPPPLVQWSHCGTRIYPCEKYR